MEIVRDAWELYLARYADGVVASVVFDLGHAEETEHEGLSACRRVILFAAEAGVRSDGLLRGSELQRLAVAETLLVESITRSGADCRKVAHLTYGGLRDVVFQVEPADAARFDAAVERWRAAAGRAGLKSELRASDGWAFFDARVRPQPHHWAWIGNRRAVDQLRAAGRDVQREHALEHIFLGGVTALEAVAIELRTSNLPDQSRDGDRLLVVQRLPLDVDAITTWTLHFESLAARCGATYDGWGLGTLPLS